MATDQEIRDAGFKYIPQQQYLLNPFQLPENQEPVVNQGIVNTNAFTGGGGGGFSVYNPDPNSIVNREYDPRPYYDATYEDTFGTNLGDPAALTATGAEFYEPPPSKMEGLLSMVPYLGSLTRGAKFLGDQISPFLPVNRRSILENQLSGQGVMVNDIGQIVQGQGAYDTAANVMAGYNPVKMTAKTFDDRIASLGNMTPEGRAKREAAIEAAKADFLNAQGKTDKIYDFEEDEKEKKKKDTIIGKYITKRNEKKAIKAAKDAEAAAAAAAAAASGGSGRSYDAPGGVRSSDYNQAANIAGGGGGSKATYQGKTARERTYDGSGTKQGYSQHYARGGRAGYFFGGRVNFKNGGLASIL
jgi:hypothetical protein